VSRPGNPAYDDKFLTTEYLKRCTAILPCDPKFFLSHSHVCSCSSAHLALELRSYTQRSSLHPVTLSAGARECNTYWEEEEQT
jgi:hypothetical protein